MMASTLALAMSLAWPIGLAAAIGLVAGGAFPNRPGRPVLGLAALLVIAAGAVVSALGLVPGRDGLWLDIGVALAAAYAVACLAASLARRGVMRALSGRRPA